MLPGLHSSAIAKGISPYANLCRQEYKLFMGVFRDRTWEELRRIGTARGSWSDHFPLCFWSGQNKPFPNHN